MEYTAYEYLNDEKMIPHRMREIRDVLTKTQPDLDVEFRTCQTVLGSWQIEYKIWKPGNK